MYLGIVFSSVLTRHRRLLLELWQNSSSESSLLYIVMKSYHIVIQGRESAIPRFIRGISFHLTSSPCHSSYRCCPSRIFSILHRNRGSQDWTPWSLSRAWCRRCSIQPSRTGSSLRELCMWMHCPTSTMLTLCRDPMPIFRTTTGESSCHGKSLHLFHIVTIEKNIASDSVKRISLKSSISWMESRRSARSTTQIPAKSPWHGYLHRGTM